VVRSDSGSPCGAPAASLPVPLHPALAPPSSDPSRPIAAALQLPHRSCPISSNLVQSRPISPHLLSSLQAEAIRRLDTFDLVGPLACMRPLLLKWGKALQWPQNVSRLDTAIAQALRHKPQGVSRGGALWRASRKYTLGGLNASEHATLLDRAACDHQVYIHMLRRLGVTMVPPLGQGLGADACAQSLAMA